MSGTSGGITPLNAPYTILAVSAATGTGGSGTPVRSVLGLQPECDLRRRGHILIDGRSGRRGLGVLFESVDAESDP